MHNMSTKCTTCGIESEELKVSIFGEALCPKCWTAYKSWSAKGKLESFVAVAKGEEAKLDFEDSENFYKWLTHLWKHHKDSLVLSEDEYAEITAKAKEQGIFIERVPAEEQTEK
jgi:Zn-finger nucleic acid-binding protein